MRTAITAFMNKFASSGNIMDDWWIDHRHTINIPTSGAGEISCLIKDARLRFSHFIHPYITLYEIDGEGRTYTPCDSFEALEYEYAGEDA